MNWLWPRNIAVVLKWNGNEANFMKEPKILTLCYLRRGDQILLGMKKRGFGAGQWNGFGGKLNLGESIEEATKREVKEESGLVVNTFKKLGLARFEFQDDPERVFEVHIFSCYDFSGEPQETEEMKPVWFEVNNLPYKSMWSSDAYWLPVFLANKTFRCQFLFDRPSTPDYPAQVISHELFEEVNV